MASFVFNQAKRLAVLLALPLAAPAIAKGQPEPLDFTYMGGQVSGPVEQQSRTSSAAGTSRRSSRATARLG
jgi:hypothetical protein